MLFTDETKASHLHLCLFGQQEDKTPAAILF
jgi:hypothetical protein